MKKLIHVLLSLFCCMTSFAQDGLFVRAQAGAGTSTIKDISEHFGNARDYCDCGYDLGSPTTSASVGLNAEIGYQYKIVRLTTGLEFITTGNLQNARAFSFSTGVTHYYPLTDVYKTYNHLLIPVSLSFKIPLSKRSSLFPEIGTRIMFISENDKLYGHSDIKGHFLAIKMNYEYALSKKLSVAITPAWYSIATPVFYTPKADYNRLISFNSVLMLQAGVVWHMHHPNSGNQAGTGTEENKKK